MAKAEVSISVRIDPDGEGHGISANAEEIVNDISYYGGSSVPDVLWSAQMALEAAAERCETLAEERL